MRIFAIVILGLSIIGLPAATNLSLSTSWVDVSNAIYAASSGDTVQIPSGTSTWAGGISVGKSIILRGSGATETKIILSNRVILTWSGVASNSGFRMTGICFTNAATNLVVTCPVVVNGPLLTFRIDNCAFYSGSTPLFLSGRIEGLIDHNLFYNCERSILVVGDSTNSWNRPIIPGTTNCVVIEDNTFYLDDAFTRISHNQDVYNQDGGRSTTRYNTWDHNGYTRSDAFWDSHGEQSSGTIWAQPLCEMYLNTINASNCVWFDGMNTRGGSCLIWSNAWNLSTYLSSEYVVKLVEEAEPNKPYYGGNPVTNTFIWGNYFRGSEISQARVAIASSKTNDTILLNRDFWMESPNATNGLPSGIYNGYRPLAYPHPLAIEPIPPAQTNTVNAVFNGGFYINNGRIGN